MSINITHISTSDILGGSARSAYRIHKELLNKGHMSRMLVGHKFSTDQEINLLNNNRVSRAADRLFKQIGDKTGFQDYWLPSNKDAAKHPFLSQSQIIQLYNLHGGYSSLTFLKSIGQHKPIVWRLSDLWPMTGRCVYPGPCEKWRTGCGSCPSLSEYPATTVDKSAWLWKKKAAIYQSLSNVTIVAPSSWTEQCAKESPLLNGFDVRRIPNGIDQTIFHPMEKGIARNILNIPENKKVIFFSAHVAYDNPRKGTHLLERILHLITDPENTIFMVAGDRADDWNGKIPCQVHSLGRLHDDISISIANNAADVVVIPSTVENLPNTALEALACGTPLVGFDVGGIKDAIQNNNTGFLIEQSNVESFAMKLDHILSDEKLSKELGFNAAALARNTFSLDAEVTAFETLYTDILSNQKRYEQIS